MNLTSRFKTATQPWLDRWVTFENLAQGFHLTLSWVFVQNVGHYSQHPRIVLAVVLSFWAWKEGYYDKIAESPEVAGSGWLDFASGAVGSVIGFLLV
jgi:hypothetical protein